MRLCNCWYWIVYGPALSLCVYLLINISIWLATRLHLHFLLLLSAKVASQRSYLGPTWSQLSDMQHFFKVHAYFKPDMHFWLVAKRLQSTVQQFPSQSLGTRALHRSLTKTNKKKHLEEKMHCWRRNKNLFIMSCTVIGSGTSKLEAMHSSQMYVA